MDNKKKTKIKFIKKSPSSEYGAYRVGDFGYIDGYTQGCAVIILENGKFATAELNWIKVVNNEDENLSLELEGDKSSKDDEIRKMLIQIVNITPAAVAVKNREKLLAWLEKQGGQKFAEWREEDKKMLNDIISDYEYVDDINFTSKIDFINSLSPKSHWKPSEEQLIALDTIKHFMMPCFPILKIDSEGKAKAVGNHRGQFCSQEQQRIEHENKVLRIKVQRYLRAWHAAVCRAAKAERELLSLKQQYNYEQNHIQQQPRRDT